MGKDSLTSIPVSKETAEKLKALKRDFAAAFSEDLSWDDFMNRVIDLLASKDIATIVDRIYLELRLLGKLLNRDALVEYSCNPGIYRESGVYEEYELCIGKLKLVVRYDGLNDRIEVLRVER